ncbi:MAG: NAD(+)/NADH kinase [Woeseiaceae bacterium]|nr:NAD(+)/NADH kinase [Woeseiaceae bacterium]
MGLAFTKIALVGRPEDERVIEPIQQLADHLAGSGVELYSASKGINDKVKVVDEATLSDTADLIVAVGGDGTMLYAGALARKRDIPLLGVNRGRLGFLADVIPDEMTASLDQVLAGNYTRESRVLMRATLSGAGKTKTAYGINDVVLQRRETGRMVDFETWIGNDYVNTHSGDGLIVATPTGSTAYALSCGGPILSPQLDALVLVPVAPHTLTDRPIVIPSNQTVEVVIVERDVKAEITVDGVSLGEIKPGDRLTVGQSDGRVTLIHPPGYDYFDILRSKLYWGKDSRNRGTPGDRAN